MTSQDDPILGLPISSCIRRGQWRWDAPRIPHKTDGIFVGAWEITKVPGENLLDFLLFFVQSKKDLYDLIPSILRQQDGQFLVNACYNTCCFFQKGYFLERDTPQNWKVRHVTRMSHLHYFPSCWLQLNMTVICHIWSNRISIPGNMFTSSHPHPVKSHFKGIESPTSHQVSIQSGTLRLSIFIHTKLLVALFWKAANLNQRNPTPTSTATLAKVRKVGLEPGTGKSEKQIVEIALSTIDSVYHPPRMPVANEGFVWDSGT